MKRELQVYPVEHVLQALALSGVFGIEENKKACNEGLINEVSECFCIGADDEAEQDIVCNLQVRPRRSWICR